MTPLWIAVTLTLLVALGLVWRRAAYLRRESFIRTFELPRGLLDKLREKRPALTRKDCQLVSHALRQFFLAYRCSTATTRGEDPRCPAGSSPAPTAGV